MIVAENKASHQILTGETEEGWDYPAEYRHMFGQSLLLGRRLIEAGTRFVQVNWPSVANGNAELDSWDTHAANFGPLKNLHCPKLDRALSALLDDMSGRYAEFGEFEYSGPDG